MIVKYEKVYSFLILGLIGGIVMGLTVTPNNSLWFWAWIALIPLWISIRRASLATTIVTAIIWGCSYHGIALFWITGIHPMTWMGVSWWNSLLIAICCWFLITAWGMILVVTWIYLCHLLFTIKLPSHSLFNRLITKMIVAVSLWCLLEKIWSFTPLWWTSISVTQSPNNLAILQLLTWSGPTTITALIVITNILLAESIIISLDRSSQKYKLTKLVNIYLLLGIFLLFTSHIIGLKIYREVIEIDTNKNINIGIIQGNIPNEIKLYDPGLESAIDNYSKGYQTLAEAQVDLILTPETALPFFYAGIKKNSSFYPLIKEKKIPILLGAFKKLDRIHYKNSLFMIDREGEVMGRYDKIKLVPLGEYIPFNQILGEFISRLSPLDTYLIPGDQTQVLTTPFGQATAGICYDSAFSDVFREQTLAGGEFMVTASNNAHYSEIMPQQHHAQDVMRAIENDRWMARATNTGYSAIIDPHGNTVWLSQINQYQIHQDIIYRRHNLTLYVERGDWLIVLLTGFICIYGINFLLLPSKQ